MTVSPGDSAKSFSHLVGIEIKVAMTRREIRQSQLARMMGVNEQWLSVRLTGKQEIGMNDLARIAAALEVPVQSLLPPVSVANTLRNRSATTRTTPDLAERTNASPVSSGRPPREPKRQRTRPGGLTPKAASRRPAMLPRPAVA